jgi:predicted ester cyclase
LEQVYRSYIAALNDRRLEDLEQFVHDRLTYNDEEWTREKYRELLAADVRNIPDLHYDVRILVAGPGHVACRIWFDCTPQQRFLGIDAGGRRVSFAEHVFYRFRANRIAAVWSLIDVDGVRRQVSEQPEA